MSVWESHLLSCHRSVYISLSTTRLRLGMRLCEHTGSGGSL